MKCKCLDHVNTKLREKGMKLSDKLVMFEVTESLGFKTVFGWPLERLDGKELQPKDPKTMQMAFCPFCGKYAA